MRTAAGIFLLWFGALLAQSAPAEAPTVKLTAAKPKPLLLLSLFNGENIVVRALSATARGNVLQAELEDGRPAAWNNTAITGNLPWYTDAELADSNVDLGGLITLYDNAGRERPAFRAGLAAETARVRAGLATRQEKAAAVLAGAYDLATPYTPEQLNRRIQAGEEASLLAPEQRAAIEEAIAPLREHLANLQAGKVFSAGGWRSPEEIRALEARAAEAARLQALSAQLTIPLDAQIISADTVNRMLAAAGVALAVPILLGAVLVFRRQRLAGGLCILLPAAAGIYYASLLGSANLTLPAPSNASGAEASAQTIALALEAGKAGPPALVPPAQRTLRLSEGDVNAFLAQHAQVRGAAIAGAVNLRGLAAQFTNGGAVILEIAEWRGRPLLIRQNFQFQTGEGRTVVSDGNVSVGEAPLPGPAQRALRDSLAPQLARFLAAQDSLSAYAVTSLSPGGLELTSTAPTPAPVAQATPPPAPTAAPPPAGTPMPSATALPALAAAATSTPTPEPEDVEPPPLSAAGTAPGPDNSFYIYAIWDQINSAPEAEVSSQMDRLREQCGAGNRFHHVGFAFILGGNEARLRSICGLARQKGLAIGVILGAQTHSGGGKNEVQEDFRAAQWRLGGAEWRGGDGGRDHLVPTPSRYCALVRDALEKSQRQRCEMLGRVMQAYPGVITCIDSSIEEELADGGQTSDDKLADYSPFAVTEFRDWLRHTGQYDADTGRYAGQGAPEQITGRYTFAKGKLRSPFYGAADPNAPAGGGSFNGRFGTKFTAWTLKYWDLEAFPGKITDDQFNPTPEAGRGYTEGGFDAPRKRDASPWWTAWSWDYQDRGNRYPPGDPAAPAFGFRQVMVHDFVVDLLKVAVKARLPSNLLFAHQIPGETAGAPRDRSAASPTWTGFLPFNGTVGITRFGSFDPKLALNYTKTVPQSRGWGIFEWHPQPDADPKSAKLYQKASGDLQTYYRAKCHHLFAGWWSVGESKQSKTFPLADSEFAHAIKDFMASRPDQPYPGTPR